MRSGAVKRVGIALAAFLGIFAGTIVLLLVAAVLVAAVLTSDEMAPIQTKLDPTLSEPGAWHAGRTTLCAEPGRERWMEVEARELESGWIRILVGEHYIEAGEERAHLTQVCLKMKTGDALEVSAYIQRPGQWWWLRSEYGGIGGVVRVSSDGFASNDQPGVPGPALVVFYDLLTRRVEGSERSVGLVALRSGDVTR